MNRNSIVVDALVVGIIILIVIALSIGGCGQITTTNVDASNDAAVATDVAQVSDGPGDGPGTVDGGIQFEAIPSCVPGCIPVCGDSVSSRGCKTCVSPDAGYPSQSCGPEGFSVCCRYAPTGPPYCQSTELCP